MIITTAKNAKFDTTKPARSSTLMVLDSNGKQVMDVLRITGKISTVTEFMEDLSMIEVEGSFGITEVSEDFVWQ